MKIDTRHAFLVMAFFLFGCGAKTPSCGDEYSKNHLIDIVKSMISEDAGDLASEIAKNITISIENSVVVDKNEKLDSYKCKAQVRYSLTKEKVTALTGPADQELGYMFRDLANLHIVTDSFITMA